MNFKSNYIFLIIFSFSNIFLYSQSSEYGNLRIYTREAYLSSIGYYSGSHTLPVGIDAGRINFSGIVYTHNYDLSNMGSIYINSFSEIRFTLDGLFKIGVAYGSINTDSDDNVFGTNNIKYYQANLDFFTLSINPEYTFIFKHGYALTIHFGIDLVNIGGTASIFEGDQILERSVGQINLIPLAFRPAFYFDFGNSGLGIGAYINPKNILSFRYSSEELYPNDKWGIKTFDNFFKRYEFQIIFTF